MAFQSPTVEEMFQQMLNHQHTTMNAIQDLVNRSNACGLDYQLSNDDCVA